MKSRLSHTARLLALLSLLVFSTGCATTPVAVTDYDRGYDFSGIRHIAIQPIDRSIPSNVAISDLQIERINAALTAVLREQGIEVVSDTAEADLLLSWHLITHEAADVRHIDTSVGYQCWNCGVGVGVGVSLRDPVREGTFIVDLIDPVKLRSVWRATVDSRMDVAPDSAEAAELRRSAARAVFGEFPPGSVPAQ